MAGARVAKRVWTEHGVVGLWRWQVWGYGFVEVASVGLWVCGGWLEHGDSWLRVCGFVGLWRW